MNAFCLLVISFHDTQYMRIFFIIILESYFIYFFFKQKILQQKTETTFFFEQCCIRTRWNVSNWWQHKFWRPHERCERRWTHIEYWSKKGLAVVHSIRQAANRWESILFCSNPRLELFLIWPWFASDSNLIDSNV